MADSAHARIPGDPPHQAAAISNARVRIAGIDVDWLDEAGAVEHVMRAAALGQGGWVATPNVDICRSASKDPVLHGLLARASLVVSDGMPLLWAARLRGTPLPERVTGASLIFSLSAAAARNSRSIYLLGGAPGVPDLAGAELSRALSRLDSGRCARPAGWLRRDGGRPRSGTRPAAGRGAGHRVRGPRLPQAGAPDRPARPVAARNVVRRMRGRDSFRGRGHAQGSAVDADDGHGVGFPLADGAATAVPAVPG